MCLCCPQMTCAPAPGRGWRNQGCSKEKRSLWSPHEKVERPLSSGACTGQDQLCLIKMSILFAVWVFLSLLPPHGIWASRHLGGLALGP